MSLLNCDCGACCELCGHESDCIRHDRLPAPSLDAALKDPQPGSFLEFLTVQPLTPDAAQVRLAQYGERAKTWSTATYDSGTEKALHEIALTLSAEVDRVRAERDALNDRLHRAAMTKTWTNEDGKKFVFVEDIAGPLLGRAAAGRAE